MGKIASPIQEIETRLAAQNGTGDILEGWTISKEPISETLGADDLPVLYISNISYSEGVGPKYYPSTTISLSIEMSVARGSGISELMLGVEKVIDAIETNSANEVDKDLANTISENLNFSTSEVLTTQNAYSTTVSVNIKPLGFERGTRRI